MANGHAKKTLARKYAFKFLYQKSLNEFSAGTAASDLEHEMDEFDESYVAPDDEHEDNELENETRFFGRRLVLDTFSNIATVRERLAPCLEPRSIEKLDHLERTIILLGTTEMLTRQDTPRPIIINEYIEMAKEFGNQKSYTFVNGVLDKLAKALR